MMNRLTNTNDNLDVRSEKVRKVLGNLPPALIRWSIITMIIIILALLAALFLLPYPYAGGESILYHII